MGYCGTHWGSSYLLVFKEAITGTVINDKLRVKSLTRWLGNVGNTDHSETSSNFRDKPFQCPIINLKTKPIVYYVILQNVLFGCINNIGYGVTPYLNYISCSMYTSFFVTVIAAPAIL